MEGQAVYAFGMEMVLYRHLTRWDGDEMPLHASNRCSLSILYIR